MKKIEITIWTMCLFLFCSTANAQPVSNLLDNYSGKATWNKKTNTLTFKSTGTIFFPEKTADASDLKNACKNNFWEVPTKVKKISIKKNVTVTGAFHTFDDIEIEGEDRNTSVIFGTETATWADANNPAGLDLKEWYYAQIQNFKGTMHIRNITILNPFSYFVRGFGPIIHMKGCKLIDNRGGHHNHSDGFCGGNGSTVDDCYFECGDDVFKAYFSYEVSNCTVKMIDNAVPIQLGWGNYSDGAVCSFKNLKIMGSKGRYSTDMAVISGRKGRFTVTINIDGCHIDNPNAVLISLWEEGMVLNGSIDEAEIKVKTFSQQHDAGSCNLTICGSSDKLSTYSCGKN